MYVIFNKIRNKKIQSFESLSIHFAINQILRSDFFKKEIIILSKKL